VLPKNSSDHPFDYDSTNSRTPLLLLLSEKFLKKIFLMTLVAHTTCHNFVSSSTFTYVVLIYNLYNCTLMKDEISSIQFYCIVSFFYAWFCVQSDDGYI